jgi:hypothetical protein
MGIGDSKGPEVYCLWTGYNYLHPPNFHRIIIYIDLPDFFDDWSLVVEGWRYEEKWE